jgi:hypothetical protein
MNTERTVFESTPPGVTGRYSIRSGFERDL